NSPRNSRAMSRLRLLREVSIGEARLFCTESADLLRTVAAGMNSIDGLPVEVIAVPGDGRLLGETRLSDHSSFWDEGFPALMITDTSFFRNPHYHRASDTAETLNYD